MGVRGIIPRFCVQIGSGAGVEGPCFWCEGFTGCGNEIVCVDKGVERRFCVRGEGCGYGGRRPSPFICERGGVEGPEYFGFGERGSDEGGSMDLVVSLGGIAAGVTLDD